MTWDQGDDADGCPFSGSMKRTEITDYAVACANVTVGATYTFGGSFKTGTSIGCWLWGHAGTNCTGARVDNPIATILANTSGNSWVTVKTTFVLSASFGSFASLEFWCDGGVGDLYDKIFFSPGNGQF